MLFLVSHRSCLTPFFFLDVSSFTPFLFHAVPCFMLFLVSHRSCFVLFLVSPPFLFHAVSCLTAFFFSCFTCFTPFFFMLFPVSHFPCLMLFLHNISSFEQSWLRQSLWLFHAVLVSRHSCCSPFLFHNVSFFTQLWLRLSLSLFQTNVIEASPDMKRESEKEWYFGNKDKERLGPYSFDEVSTFPLLFCFIVPNWFLLVPKNNGKLQSPSHITAGTSVIHHRAF